MLTLPVYRRGQTYYLHTRIAGRQFKRSLQTADPTIARLRALELLRVIAMTKPKLSEFDFNSSDVSRYEFDLAKGIAKSDGPEDHARMLDAIKAVAAVYTAPKPPEGALLLSDKHRTGNEAPARAGLRLLEVLDKMIGLRTNLKSATVLSYKNTAKEFSAFLKAPFIQDIGPGDVTRFQEQLNSNGNNLRTIDNKVATLRALFNFAKKQGYYFAENPAGNRSLLSKKEKIRERFSIFTLDEIKLIYSSDFLKERKIKKPDYYWTLVLTLLTGLRIGEVTSLKAEQLRFCPSFVSLKITDSKTIAGIREVPIPIEIMQTGFGDFIKGKAGPLFKYTAREGYGTGNAAGQMFGRHVDAVGIEDKKLVFHSLRKFLNDYFQKGGMEFEPRCQFLGHEVDSVNVSLYTNPFTDAQLFKMTRKMQLELLQIAVQ